MMASFDAIRAAHVGAVSYLCKKQPPAELLGCWPMNGNTNDVSRYGNNLACSPTYYDSDFFVGTKQIGFGANTRSISLPLAKSLDLTSPWSIDWIQFKSSRDENSSLTLSFGNLSFRAIGGYSYTISDGTSTISSTQWPSPSPYAPASSTHWAIRYDGTSIKWFTSGILRYTYTLTPDGNSGAINAQFYSGYNAYSYIQNFRVAQKLIGTTTSFPVPSGLYTGYETL